MNQICMEITDQNTIILSNRSGNDRRTKSGFSIRSLLLGGRREKIRRQEDTKRIFYVDQFSPVLFFTIVSILFLCVIDALLTLRLWSHGAYEVNPVMAYFLGFGPYTFLISKYEDFHLPRQSECCILGNSSYPSRPGRRLICRRLICRRHISI